MDTIEKFSQWQASQNISYGVAAKILNYDRGCLAQVIKGQIKCPEKLGREIDRFVKMVIK